MLISRGTPCRPTPHGEWLVRLGRQTRLLYDEASPGAGAAATAVELPVAVNADSLAAWFRDVLAEGGGAGTAPRSGCSVEDQALLAGTAAQRRRARGGHQRPGPGAGLRRRAARRAALPARRRAGARRPVAARATRPDWAAMPVVVFNAKDDLQHDMLRRHGVRQGPPVVHQVPSTADFYEAVRIGLGWGMLPEPQAARRPGRGRARPAVTGRDRRPAVLAALAPRLAAARRAHRRGARRRRPAPAARRRR